MTRLGVCVLGLTVAVAGGCSNGKVAPSARGRVLFQNRQPTGSATVRVTGCADQTTSADGSFDTSCAAAIYDVAVKWAETGLLYQGLTRRDPVVTMPGTLASLRQSTVSGTVTGLTAGRAVMTTVTSSEYSATCSQTADGSFGCLMQWFDATPPQATVRALEWVPASGLPTSFIGYGTAAVTLVEGVNITAAPVVGTIANGAIFAAISDLDLTWLSFGLWITWPDGSASLIVKDALDGARGAMIATPDIAGASFAVLAERGLNPTAWAWRRGLAATSTPAEIVLPSAPAFSAPASSATVELSTDFTFGPLADSVYMVAFEPSTFIGPRFYVVTRSTTVRIPDFSWTGLALPTAASLRASVFAIGPCTSMDEATGSSDLLSYLPNSFGLAFPDRVPMVDGFATRYVRGVTTP